MPQHFQVLRCYKCLVFQVHQAKKSNKFQCKLCGEKQSIKRHYGLGTGKDCRLHVQKLNGIRGELEELSNSLELNRDNDDDNVKNEKSGETKPNIENLRPNKSKWSDYVENEKDCEVNTEEIIYLDNKEVVLEVPKKRFKKSRKSFKSPAMKPAKRNEYEDTYSNEIVSSNEIVDYSVKDNMPIRYMNVPFSSNTKLQSTQNYDNMIYHSSMLNSEPVHIENKPVNVQKQEKLAPKKCKLPTIRSNSKWAQFVENEDQEEEESNELPFLSYNQPSIDSQELPLSSYVQPSNDPQALFSLCDDCDLANVLDF